MRLFPLAQAAAVAVVAPRLLRGRRRAAPLAPSEAAAATAPVSVVIPARDEEARLGPCLEGLAGERLLEVIVVDDCSTDATAAVATARGARVLTGTPPPDGWAGKTWALQQGLEAARGGIVVFLDADTRPQPGLLGALAEQAGEKTVVSVAPRFECAGEADTAVNAAFAAALIYQHGALDVEGWQPAPERALLNGQCVCVRREEFAAAGGWGLVRGHMTEDVALARALRRQGWSIVFRVARDLLRVEAYASASETWLGWGRSMLAPDVTPRPRLVGDVAVLWLCWALPIPRLLTGRATLLDKVLVLVRIALLGALAPVYTRRGPGLWLSFLADVPVAARLSWSVARPTRTWRGRTYAPGTEGR